MVYYTTEITTNIGDLRIAVNASGKVCAVEFLIDNKPRIPIVEKLDGEIINDSAKCGPVVNEILEYLDGKRKTFSIQFELKGTDFQIMVWNELIKIPYGETISYRELAKRIGNPKAVRAVGTANGKNPVSIFIPCHRVIGSDGSLAGYGGGISIKRKLLDMERTHVR